MAIDREDVAAVQAMLERNSGLATARLLSPDAPVKGTTFLHRIVQAYSTSAKDVAIARLLIKHGANVNAEGGQARGSAPDIAAAVIAGDAESVAAILSENPQAIHQHGPNQWTLLDLAVKYGHDEVEMLLRAAGATLSQNLEALFREVGPDHSVHKVLRRRLPPVAPNGFAGSARRHAH